MHVLITCLIAHLCLPAAVGYPELLFANRKDIRIIEVGRERHHIIVKDVTDAACVDYYYKGQLVCWTDIDNELIKCVQVNSTHGTKDHTQVTVISRGIVSPDGLAVDWLGRKLYWTDSDTNKIEVAGLYTAAHRRVLFWQDLDQPRAIALVPSEGLMFWTDWGENPKIERAGMNGDAATRTVIVQEEIFWPNGLTIDTGRRVIYWADAKLSYIASVDFDGRRRKKVVQEKLPHPFALTYFNHTLYWTDWETRAIHYCTIDDGRACQEQHQLGAGLSPMYLHVYDPAQQPPADTPCQRANGGCSHLCLAAPPPTHYSCACPTGVKLLDKFNCSDGPEEMLILARRTDLRRISLDTPDHTAVVIPVSGVRHAIAVDYDPIDAFVYWTDDEVECIQRSRLDGTQQEVVVSREVRNPDGVAVDWVARNLYWTDTWPDRIEVARLNGTSRKILITDNLDEPRAIAIDPDEGLMFWTDWGSHPKIERAALDGTMRQLVVGTDLGWPNGVVIDTKLRRIFWCDAKMDVIETSLLDGTERQVVLNDRLPHVFGLSLLGEHIYWTDWQRRSIERVNKLTGGEREVIVEQLPDLMGLKAVSIHQGHGSNPCKENNGGCSHLCLNRPTNYTCGCPIGYDLTQNARQCVIPEAFLLYTRKEDIRRISLLTSHNVPIPVTGIQEAVAIDFDSIDNRLYWTDISVKSISRAFMNGSQMEPVVEFGLAYPEGMAVDWLARNIYWADMGNNRIEVARLDGSSRRVLLWQNIANPKSLALDPSQGYMYWSEWKKEQPSISHAHLDASQPTVIITKMGRSNGLTIDFKDRRLYWTDIDNFLIESSDLNGYNREVIVRDLPQPYGLTLYENYVYWADWKTGTIERANKTRGENRIRIQSQLDFIMDILVFHSSRQSGQNGCSHNNGGCSHLCLAVPHLHNGTHNHTCACPTHYTLDADGLTCKAPASFLLFSQKTEVSRLVEESGECPTLILAIHNMRNVRAIDFDPLEEMVYWVEGRGHTIRRAHQNGSHGQLFVTNDMEKIYPYDLALDPFSRLLVWSCARSNVINATRLDRTQLGGIIGQGGQDQPRALAIHSILGLLFFTNMVSPPRIERCRLDGRGRQVVVAEGLITPSALTVDVEDDLGDDFIFWTDTATKRIETANLNGDNRKVLVDEGLGQPVGLAVHGPFLYWVDRELSHIGRVHKFTGQEREVIQGRIPYLSDIIGVSPFLSQQMRIHPCHNGSECSHLCLERDGRQVCSCPAGRVLADDLKTCILPPSCKPEEFRCHSGSVDCIPIKWRCDGQTECTDKSDELNCPVLPICQPSQFRCVNSKCIEKAWVCDGQRQCSDGSDEVGCCGAGQVLCVSSGNCVDTAAQCSGAARRPCPDAPDLALCSTWVTVPPEASEGAGGRAPYIVGVVASVVVLACVAALLVYYRRRPALLEDHELEPHPKPGPAPQALAPAPPRQYRLVMTSWGKSYAPMVGPEGTAGEPRPPLGAGGGQVCRVVPGAGGARGGVYEAAPATGASSSSSSMTHYPRETLNPPPTPVAEGRGTRCPEHHCCYNPHHAPPSTLHSYRHYKTRNRPPPPTPCSTDVCDSDVYSSALSPRGPRCYTPPSPPTHYHSSPPMTDYDSDPHPPPPTPQMPYMCELGSCRPPTSCPPSPSTERSYCTRAPCPPPPSPITSD